MKPYHNPQSPFPFLPGYEGTTYDQEKIIRSRLTRLLLLLGKVEEKLAQKKTDISLLAELEKCQSLVSDMLEVD